MKTDEIMALVDGHANCLERKVKIILRNQIEAALKEREAPKAQPMSDEQLAVLIECRYQAMKLTVTARIPEAGAFGEIAQDLDWLCDQLATTK